MYIVSEITTSLSSAYPRDKVDKSSNLFRYRAINNTYNIRVCLGKNILIPLQNWILWLPDRLAVSRTRGKARLKVPSEELRIFQ